MKSSSPCILNLQADSCIRKWQAVLFEGPFSGPLAVCLAQFGSLAALKYRHSS